MKIVKILGGFGNQMFQYAMYLALKHKFPSHKVLTDIRCFNGYPLHNGYELERVFSITSEKANWKDVLKVAYPYPNYRSWQIGKYILPNRKTMCFESNDFAFVDDIFTNSNDVYYDGYWQCEDYFKDIRPIILKEFSFPKCDGKNQELQEKLNLKNSVSVHIRRGDYLNHPLFKGLCDLEYYQNAIKRIKDTVNPELFCIFSNDIEWCKANISNLLRDSEVVYVDWNKGASSYRDMQLMSNCKHNIIANSSFSWWGAWLNSNPNKVVIAPKRWMNIELANDPICEDWIKI